MNHPSLHALLTALVMGIFAFSNVPGLQVYVMQKAEQYALEAVDVASGLNIAAFNIGIAVGSIIGVVIVTLALILAILSGKLDKHYVAWCEIYIRHRQCFMMLIENLR